MFESFSTTTRQFWSELRRRRVVKTVIAYLIAAWVVVEVSSTVFPLIYLPEWTVRFVVILAFIGIPVVCVLAWMFDIERMPATTGKPGNEVAARQGVSSRDTNVPPLLSSAEVAVGILPFDDLSPNSEFEYIAPGIAAELHNALASMHRVRVASRRSTLQYANSTKDVKVIAQELDVQLLISGSVTCSERRLRVLVQIDDAIGGGQIWSQSYDRQIDDTVVVQQTIANDVASAFSGVRLREEIARAESLPTESLNAWSRVQKARSYLLDYSSRTLDSATDLLREAIKIDQNYAVAHAALGSVLGERMLNGYSNEFALHNTEARASAQRAAELAPGDPFVLKMSGVVYAYLGQPALSMPLLRRAVAVAPFDFGAWGYMGWPLAETGRPEDLEELDDIMSRLIEKSPEHPGCSFWLYHRSVAALCNDKTKEAINFAAAAVEKNETFPFGWCHYASILAADGDLSRASAAFDRCRKLSPNLDADYFETMIGQMHGQTDFAIRRVAGLRLLH